MLTVDSSIMAIKYIKNFELFNYCTFLNQNWTCFLNLNNSSQFAVCTFLERISPGKQPREPLIQQDELATGLSLCLPKKIKKYTIENIEMKNLRILENKINQWTVEVRASNQ